MESEIHSQDKVSHRQRLCSLAQKPAFPANRKGPAFARPFYRCEPESEDYFRVAISASRADFGGRVSDSGRVPSGSSTIFSRSMKVGFSVLM